MENKSPRVDNKNLSQEQSAFLAKWDIEVRGEGFVAHAPDASGTMFVTYHLYPEYRAYVGKNTEAGRLASKGQVWKLSFDSANYTGQCDSYIHGAPFRACIEQLMSYLKFSRDNA